MDTHEHLADETTYINNGPDVLQDLFDNYTQNDLIMAGATPESVKQLLDSNNPDIAVRWAGVSEVWQYCKHTGYGEATRLIAAQAYQMDEITLPAIEAASQRNTELRQPGERLRILKEVGNLDHVQIDNIIWACYPDPTGLDFFLYDLQWAFLMFKDINFKVFKKLLSKHKLTSITIDIDSSVVNVEGHQEGTAKGYNPKKLGNLCYNIQFAFCDELKAYITGFVRSGNTYTANGAAEMIKEIVANIKTDDLAIMFRMDSGYFDENFFETIESLGCKYLIKAKEYPTLASQVTDPPILFVTGDEGRETAELLTKQNTWKKDRRFVISRVLKPEKERAQLSLLDEDEYQYFFFVTNTERPSEKVVISYEKRGNAENYIKEAKYDMAVVHLLLKSFWANEAVFQMMMLSYNLFLLFKFDSLHISEYRQQIKTFRLKYVFLAGKIIRTARYVVMKLPAKYPYKDVYENCLS